MPFERTNPNFKPEEDQRRRKADADIDEIIDLISEAKALLSAGTKGGVNDEYFRNVFLQLLISIQRHLRGVDDSLTELERMLSAIVRAFPEPDASGGVTPDANSKFEIHRIDHAEKRESRKAWFKEGGAMFRKAAFALLFAVLGAVATALIPSLGTLLGKEPVFVMAPTNGVVK